jgi:hypothetical protein
MGDGTVGDAALLSRIAEALDARWRPRPSTPMAGDAIGPMGPTPDWLFAASGKASYEQSMARAPLHVEDAPHHAPQLQRLFAQLDLGVARFALEHAYRNSSRSAKFAAERAANFRIGSIAVDLPQQAFYWRLAASPAVRHICEVGFNAGHSTALWLSANPTATIDTFDLFSPHLTGFMRPNLLLLQRLFPGRVTAHAGNSLRTIPAANLTAPCDLVHVDGRHSYTNTLWDTVNFMRKASPSALYLFDDQCDPRNCGGPDAAVAAQPTLATCDMVEAGILVTVTAILQSSRQFALFRQNRSHSRKTLAVPRNALPCGSFCTVRMACEAKQPARGAPPCRVQTQDKNVRAAQEDARGRHCRTLPPHSP